MANIVLDFDYKNLAGFTLSEIGGVNYVDQYFDRGKYLSPHQQLISSTLRPFLDGQGVRFQDHNLSVLLGSPIPHKQAYILFNCLQPGGLYRVGSNPIYTARQRTPNISRVFGVANQKKVDAFMHVNGFVCYDASNKIPLSQADNTNPIENFRLLVVDFNAVSEGAFVLGGGSSNPSWYTPRSLNGYVKRCILLDEAISGAEQDALITGIWAAA